MFEVGRKVLAHSSFSLPIPGHEAESSGKPLSCDVLPCLRVEKQQGWSWVEPLKPSHVKQSIFINWLSRVFVIVIESCPTHPFSMDTEEGRSSSKGRAKAWTYVKVVCHLAGNSQFRLPYLRGKDLLWINRANCCVFINYWKCVQSFKHVKSILPMPLYCVFKTCSKCAQSFNQVKTVLPMQLIRI